MKNKAIGVFDSGVGGLTVLAEIRRALPNENIIYFGDDGSNSLGIKYLKNATEKYLAISIQYDKLSLLYINNNLTNADYYYLSSELGLEEFIYCISVNEFDTTYYDIKVDNFITCENSQSNKSICLSDFEYCDIKL